MIYNQLKFLPFLLTAALMLSCSSEPKFAELPIGSDPRAELNRIDGNLTKAVGNQVNVLSPKNFAAAQEARDEAVKARSNNKDQKVVLHKIALAQAYLDKANEVTSMANLVLKEPIKARQDAIVAKAELNFPAELATVDEKFKKLTEDIENNDTTGAEKESKRFEASYREIEINSIKKEKLGVAKSNMDLATKEGAAKLTPETLKWATARMKVNETNIETQRHDMVIVNAASADAIATSNRLLKMVRDAKGSTVKNPEDFAKQVESNELATAQSAKNLDSAELALAASQGKLLAADSSNETLQSQVWLDKKYDYARNQFSSDEAEVYKQGDKLLLRLKGFSFVNGKSGIQSENFSLLTKVQNVIREIGSSQIVIEGHTDSIGDKKLNEALSTKRAESVQTYLIANKNITEGKISISGLGDSKPIATNKTSAGRAQNRRVDLIITADVEEVKTVE